MRIAHALDFLHASNAAQFESLSDLISPELITTLLAEEDVATLRRRRMPMERLVWAIIGMAIFRHVPMTQLVNQLDILLPGDRPFVAPSAFLQARQKLGDKSIERLFHEIAYPQLSDGADQPPACSGGHGELQRQRDGAGRATHRAHSGPLAHPVRQGVLLLGSAPRMADNGR